MEPRVVGDYISTISSPGTSPHAHPKPAYCCGGPDPRGRTSHLEIMPSTQDRDDPWQASFRLTRRLSGAHRDDEVYDRVSHSSFSKRRVHLSHPDRPLPRRRNTIEVHNGTHAVHDRHQPADPSSPGSFGHSTLRIQSCRLTYNPFIIEVCATNPLRPLSSEPGRACRARSVLETLCD